MIGEPVKLTVRQHFSRPSKAQIGAFEGISTSFLVDAQNGTGALKHRIKPLATQMTFAGAVITVHVEPRDMLAVQPGIALAQPGDVLLIETSGYDNAAVIGDNVAIMAKNKGLKAIVTDGMVRDVGGILAAGIPVFCAGVSPNSPYSLGPGSVGLPVAINGVPIESGDLLVGDRDGVVVVAQAMIDRVIESLAVVTQLENEYEKKVLAGATASDWVQVLLDSEQTRYVD
ncbi:MAG: RraA family protein [Pseudomonadota bacterium]|nr:RraA family protein [Pseudomonadota bacterium]